jgi:predicted permease
MLSDLKFALRQIAKFPGYTAVVVLTLAFGIAVNTQIFGIVSAFFLQPMPVRDADRLTVVVERSDLFNMPHGLSFLDFRDIRTGSKTLTDGIAFLFTPAHVSIRGQAPERAWIEAVTPDAFDRLGVPAILGRPLQASDGEAPPGTPVAVLTHRYWQNHFGGDPGVIGRTILIDSRPFTIVGVAQPGFDSFSWAMSVSLFVPSGAYPQLQASGAGYFTNRGAKAWRVLAYRRPGVSVTDANAELALIAQRLGHDFPDDHPHSRFQVVAEQRARPDPSMADYIPFFAALFSGLVVLVLFIACANVANLMSARALSREKELVVRAALGASRGRLIRQLLLESVVLSCLAGLTGYLLALWGSDAFVRLMPPGDIPIRTDQSAGWQTGVFTAVISLFAGLASGLLPALRSSRIDLNESLKRNAGRLGGSTRHRLRNLLVIGQVAVSCVVLISAAVFLRGLHAAGAVNLGFRPDRLVMLSLDLGLQGYDQERGLRFQKQLVDRVRVLPGVEAASFAHHVPFSNYLQIREVWPDNPTTPIPNQHVAVSLSSVHPGYLGLMGIPLLGGREFNEADGDKAPRVAVINEAMARTFWPGREAIGQHFAVWRGGPPVEVVGLVATGKYVMLTEDPKPYFYVPFAQNYEMPATLLVRTTADGFVPDLRAAVHALDPDLPVYSVLTMDEHLASSFFALMPLRTGAMLAAAQGVIGLLLAILGLYSVVSYGVSRRTHEIGVRMALGATDTDVLRLISHEGLKLTLYGLVVGLTLGLGLSFALSRVIFGVQAFDPVAFSSIVVVLFATAVAACWLPARRATKVDPMTALRTE